MPSTAPDTSASTDATRNGTRNQVGRTDASVPTGSFTIPALRVSDEPASRMP